MKILGIDPGYERLGIAVIEKEKNAKDQVLFSECFKTLSSLPHPERLRLLGQEIERVIEEFRPEALGIETLFFNKNQKTAMHVSEARGSILYAAASKGLAIHEFTPGEIKMALSGYGKSDKDQMIKMVNLLVKVRPGIKYDDEYDAIAAGLTLSATLGIKALTKP
ncbi:MAG TPA: crossover junction endodeoxyribonuclease RuvC [Candidatus Paceibacterota bacterium]|jgi:crossover junction endodeoxyribonuclease RuvC|nr:crossover junction endodeoxyribonuclease RuvC [Candidatus Paceibacterota bacterium]